MLTTYLQKSPHVEAKYSFFLAAINVSEDKTLSEVVKTAASANANLSVMIFAYHTVQKQLTMRCSVPKKIATFTAEGWAQAVAQVVGGRVRLDAQSDTRTTAHITADKPEDICDGMACAKWAAVNCGLVDLTGPLAKAIPSYIPGNIQYADGTKNQPPPFWFHFVNLDDETDFEDTQQLPPATAVFEAEIKSEPVAGPSHEVEMEAAMVATRSRMPAVEDAMLPERKRSRSCQPPLSCDGT